MFFNYSDSVNIKKIISNFRKPLYFEKLTQTKGKLSLKDSTFTQ